MLPRKKCPRCGKSVAKLRNDALARHKDDDGLWCSGDPKSSRQLVVDLVHSLQAEKDVLREYADEMIRHTTEVVRLSEKHTGQMTTTTEIMHRVTDALEREAASRESAHSD